MINKNALNHPTIQARIFAAMKAATLAANGVYQTHIDKGNLRICPRYNGGSVYIKNRKGNAFIRVDYHKASSGSLSGFKFWQGGKDVSSLVLQAIREE